MLSKLPVELCLVICRHLPSIALLSVRALTRRLYDIIQADRHCKRRIIILKLCRKYTYQRPLISNQSIEGQHLLSSCTVTSRHPKAQHVLVRIQTNYKSEIYRRYATVDRSGKSSSQQSQKRSKIFSRTQLATPWSLKCSAGPLVPRSRFRSMSKCRCRMLDRGPTLDRNATSSFYTKVRISPP